MSNTNAGMYVNAGLLQDVSLDPEALLAFFHAQRTGGSNFKKMLRDVYGDKGVYAQQTVDGFKHWKLLEQSDLKGYKVFAGHSDFAKQPNFSRRLCLVSILRNPVYRAASLHGYCRKKTGHALQALALENDLVDFYVKGVAIKPSYFSNVQCKRVCGVANADLAISYVEEFYSAVGCTERLSDFTAMLIKIFGWKCLPLNTTISDQERYRKLINDRFLEVVSLTNKEDIKFFEYMQSKYFN